MTPLHPKIIHFPVALLISVILFALLAILIKNKRELFKEIIFWNVLIGALGSIAAVISGLIEEGTLVHNNAIHEIMETHKLLGYIIAGIYVLTSIWLLLRKHKMQIKELVLLTLILTVSAILVGYSAHLGGKMVYENGTGIKPYEQYIPNDNHEHNNTNHEHGEMMTQYTCPMHPEVVKDEPGKCPKCNMDLVEKTSSDNHHENHEGHNH